MATDYMLVRHSRKEQPVRVTIEPRGYDLTDYSYFRQWPDNPQMAEWVWTEDLDEYKKS